MIKDLTGYINWLKEGLPMPSKYAIANHYQKCNHTRSRKATTIIRDKKLICYICNKQIKRGT